LARACLHVWLDEAGDPTPKMKLNFGFECGVQPLWPFAFKTKPPDFPVSWFSGSLLLLFLQCPWPIASEFWCFDWPFLGPFDNSIKPVSLNPPSSLPRPYRAPPHRPTSPIITVIARRVSRLSTWPPNWKSETSKPRLGNWKWKSGSTSFPSEKLLPAKLSSWRGENVNVSHGVPVVGYIWNRTNTKGASRVSSPEYNAKKSVQKIDTTRKNRTTLCIK